MKFRTRHTCPLEITHDAIKGKWKPIILWSLKNGPQSLSALEKSIQGITQKMLLEQLKELGDTGFISKTSFAGYPLKVEYALNSQGQAILEAILIMQKVGMDLLAAQAARPSTATHKKVGN